MARTVLQAEAGGLPDIVAQRSESYTLRYYRSARCGPLSLTPSGSSPTGPTAVRRAPATAPGDLAERAGCSVPSGLRVIGTQ